ncbi:MAG TPA: T9SS type A sorting domain-containing protein [Clostridiales bacterium]|nr:T9SS type A sorting domain-containing protein [Clostridiales bacterium]HQP69860.1 T9SS type A sorting domain-containing protein [Clostridiales bacterium]
MKKIFTFLLVILTVNSFAVDWYSNKEMLNDAGKTLRDSKDTLWYSYVSGPVHVFSINAERATFLNVNDFGLEYPINLHAINSYLYDPGYAYSYKIYDKDGTTLLWELEEPDTARVDFYNIHIFDTPMVMRDDFWIVVVPLEGNNPRLVSSYTTMSGHSFYKDEVGNWTPFTDNADNYEWVIDFSLSPYAGTDIFPPIVRELTGTTAFKNVPMIISSTIQEQSAMNVVTGQYNIGAGWFDFLMEPVSKTNYNYTGIIPGQPHGTTGLVRIYAEDTLANSSTSVEYPILWSQDIPLISEKFEGETFPPAGWALENAYPEVTDGGFIHGIFYETVFDSLLIWDGKQAFHNYIDGDQDDWLISPKISVPSDNLTVLSFTQRVSWMSYMVYHGVSVTTDLVNWTEIYTGAPTADPSDPTGDLSILETTVLNLSAYKGQDIYIGFNYKGYFASEWHIDDVEVIYDSSAPEVVSISANPALLPVVGAYVNNPMELILAVSDVSGVASVIGHYAFGAETGDVIFTRSKGDETWTGTIPSMAAAVTGTIYFDLTDIGGLTATTSNYSIEFVNDTDGPIINYCSGRQAFIDLPMNLELSFKDESAIAQVKGHYSKDNWITQYDFDLIPSKIHEYTYLGTIPAETEQVLNGIVKFTITDTAGNSTISSEYTVKWFDGAITLYDNFESGTYNWILTGDWGLETSAYTSASHSLTESPDSVYTANNSSSATVANSIDLSGHYPYGSSSANIRFWCKYDIEQEFDYMYFEVSDDNGSTWNRHKTWTGEGVDWHEETIDLSMYTGSNQVKFRWFFVSDSGYEVNGMNIDDVTVSVYYNPNDHPVIIHDGPEFYEGTLNEYTSTATVYDMDGIDSVWVEYTVDSLQLETLLPVYTSENIWEFTIPQYPAGSRIDYVIKASDASEDHLESYTKTYSYIQGIYKAYDSGIASYYKLLENNNAMAVKITMNEDPYIYAYLLSILIRNYADAGHLSDDMQVHVWSDNYGSPGPELIPPFDVTPAATLSDNSAFTICDLRDLGFWASGDIWVGISSPYGKVYSLIESPIEAGTTAYERSSSGIWNGTEWTWSLEPEFNYQIRAITYPLDGIEDETLPENTELHQNYPNPFNPETTIKYSLKSEGQVTLSVFNTKGELVNRLVNEMKTAGNHSVNFNGDGLNSGIYFYRLSVNGKLVQSKKMMMLK